MAESTHTPGPWTVSDTSIVSEEHCIAVIEDDGDYAAPWDQRKPNARLLAAAPDLFVCLADAVELFAHDLHDGTIGGDWLLDARAALARAKDGRQ